MKASDVSGVLVTRGNVSLNTILQSLPFDDVVVWDNSTRHDLAVYGRYAAIAEAKHDVIFCQDDDCVLAPESFIQLLDAYEPGVVVCNMPERFRAHYSDSALVGFGAIFDRELPEQAFERFLGSPGPSPGAEWWRYSFSHRFGEMSEPIDSPFFNRTCDVIFTGLSERILVDAPYTDLPWATGDDRMYRQPEHVGERARMLDLARQVRDA